MQIPDDPLWETGDQYVVDSIQDTGVVVEFKT